jgi:hypothetical protein
MTHISSISAPRISAIQSPNRKDKHSQMRWLRDATPIAVACDGGESKGTSLNFERERSLIEQVALDYPELATALGLWIRGD